jgi:hypothetical protein
MLILNWPAFIARLKPTLSLPKPEELSQDDIRELHRIRSELALAREKLRSQVVLHRQFMP